MKRKLLIFDIDETLVFATPNALGRNADFRIAEYWVYKRPGLDAFLEFTEANFHMAVWTASGSLYGEAIVNTLFRNPAILKFLWTRERCTRRLNLESHEHYWVKDLKKVKRLGFALEHVLVVDDSPEKLERNYGNHIKVTPFEGDPNDSELLALQRYLAYLKTVDRLRSVDKRGWRRSFGSAGDF